MGRIIKVRMDTSTINQEELEKFLLLRLPEGYTLGSPGMGCYLDPPGYPSYFLQAVYTPGGDSSARLGFPEIAILGRVVVTVGSASAGLDEAITALWSGLPYAHPRVQAWILSTYHHHQGGYVDGEGKIVFQFELNGRKREFEDHEGFRDDWREKQKAVIAAFNKEIDREWARIAIPENASAVRHVRRHYPEHQPRLDLLGKREGFAPPGWWSVLAECPKPEDCPGEIRHLAFRYGLGQWGHPVNKTWCQVCGWREER